MSDMTEFFTRDPLELTDKDIDAAIAYYREQRHLFNSGATVTKAAPAKLTKGQEEAAKLDLKLDL